MKPIDLPLPLIAVNEKLTSMPPKKPQTSTSWGKEADWYQDLLAQEGTYQTEVILPNLLRVMGIKKNQTVLELGSGTGFFARAFAKAGAKVTGVELGAELVAKAKSITKPAVAYQVSSAESIPFIKDASVDTIAIILALQNMEKVHEVLKECARVLKPGGKLCVVLNHPAFRIPQASGWGWDEQKKVQYRRVDRYLSEMKLPIQMHPGSDPSAVTWSFHRPLQLYFKLFAKNALAVVRLEEWTSHTKTPHGPRAEAENRARVEFPMFMCLELIKIG